MTTEPMKEAAEQAAAENQNPGEPSPLEAELEAVKTELAQLREDSLRERADVENQRKRLARELDMARKFANERLLSDLLPVIDSLEAALQAGGGETAVVREGVELTLKMLMKAAADHGMSAVDPVGQPFNPEHHPAMSTVESDQHAPGHVVQVYQKGWLLNERLLRPALVVVCKQD